MGATRAQNEGPAIEEARWALLGKTAAFLAMAAAVFFLAYTNGGFDSTTRAYAAIAAWWVLGVGAALGLGAARAQVGRLALVTTGLFALFAAWILASVDWAADAERAFAQFDQVALYVAVLLFGILLARLVPVSVLVGGVALGLSGVAVIALVSRLFPSTFATSASSAQFLHPLGVRLSFPLGYWNGLGIEVALAYPLLLATMASRRHPLARAAAALPLPVLAADMYLTSSRGAFVAAAVAVAAYLVLSPQRWTALAATIVAGIAGAVAVAFIVPRKALVNGEMTTALGVHQGHQTAVAVAVIAVAIAGLWFLVGLARRWVPAVPPLVGWLTAGLIVALVAAAIVSAHPVRRFEQFKTRPTVTGSTNFVTDHLLSSSGSGRWQLWSSAVSEFREHPLQGAGAGSFESWWLQHGYFFTPFAHSLYLEALGELGVIGLLLLGGAVIVGVVGAVRAVVVLRSSDVAAAAAVGIAFFAAAAYDWVWQLAAIAVVGVGLLGVALGAHASGRARAWGRFGVVRPLFALLAVAAIVPQIVILSASLHLRNSQAAFDAKNIARAKAQAVAAKTVEPWAASPYLQLAEIEASEKNYAAASAWISSALKRSPNDYFIWYTAAGIDTLRGRLVRAQSELERARELYPGSALFQASGS